MCKSLRPKYLIYVCVLSGSLLEFRSLAIVDANSQLNTSAPADGAPWDNVGQLGGASGVYIGGGWVLTASHVGVGSITLSGSNYSPDGTSLRLTNSDGTATDLILFHLGKMPPLPSLPLVSTTPAALSQVDIIGNGHIAGSTQTNIGIYTGFYWSAGGAKSWGNNKVNLGGVSTINAGFGNLTAFAMDFTSPSTVGPTSQTSDESMVSAGDSGGGAFQKIGGSWQLVGILDAEQTQLNQPASTSVYGDTTYAADIATYRSEVVAVLNAGPVPNLSLTRSNGTTLVCWPDTGVNYTLQASSSLLSSSWTAVSQARTSTNGQICVLVPEASPGNFYRLQKP